MEMTERHITEQSQTVQVQSSHEGPKDLTLIRGYPLYIPGKNEYLIRVGAAGVNFADVMQAHGDYEGGPTAPYIAGFEAAGEIMAVGQGTENPLPTGTRVVGSGYGASAQYMLMPSAGVLPVPPGWSDAQSLGLVINWATALAAQMLGEIKRGETVLIHAAAGGVGQAAVRLARHYGATVIATASPARLQIPLVDHLEEGRSAVAGAACLLTSLSVASATIPRRSREERYGHLGHRPLRQ
ncbi:alcohol dehydrogenase catalytic domain-containing protein [Streptomyces sp. NPDC096339]|uniref:alcohol dehydrogenase catalytic domain-containing protein n=1 Tax=Streptomyces sp. NPDC096339 TaxID=3366086 RepID=UPI00382D2BD2